MKIKSLLLSMTCVAAFAACSNEDVVENNPIVDNKIEGDAYVAVDIALAGDRTRATGGAEEDGLPGENGITDVAFLFYNGDKLLQTVRKADLATDDNDITKAVIVLKNPGVVPTSVVAVLNPTSDTDAFSATLTGLKAKTDYAMTSEAAGKFVMSNSTFKNADGTVQMETPITPANVATTAEKAKLTPINIYVERALAKVTADFDNMRVELPKASIDGAEAVLTAEISGWNLSGTNKTSYVLKSIDANWGGNWWIGTNRTFWAKDANYSATGTGLDALTFYPYSTAKPAQAYCLENTLDSYSDNYLAATHLLVSAVIKVGGEAKSLYEYLGQKYTETGVQNLMSKNSNVAKFYIKTSADGVTPAEYESLKPEFIGLDSLSETSYMVTPQLTDVALAMQFYTLNADKTIATEVASSVVDAAVKALGDVAKYNGGKCYYFVPIEHFGEKNGLGEYGIVRNHVYNVTINSIKGFGTPVPDPDQVIIPKKPSKDDYFVAAKVNVLKWKIVSQSVDLE